MRTAFSLRLGALALIVMATLAATLWAVEMQLHRFTRDERLPMMALSASTCRWPIGDPGDTEFHFCGERSLDGKPYCSAHASIAYVKMKPRTEAA